MSRRGLGAAAAVLLLAACSAEETVVEGTTTASEPPPATSEAETTTEAARPERLRVRVTEILSGLEAPTHVASTPSEPDRLYVVERPGRIRVLAGGELAAAPFLDISDRVLSGGEQGLLSVAFHPDYEANGRFYVNYTGRDGDTRVVEYERGQGGPEERRELLLVEQPYANHNGGQLAFDPSGLLWVGMGDGGSAGDPENRAQDLGSRLGKLLTLDVDDPGADWRIAAYGLRNPWRFSFDRATGDLYIGDVGQGEREEIDYDPAPGTRLVNYGWDVFEGTQVYEDKEPDPRGQLVDPIAEYSHADGNCSVTGGFVYRGERIPAAEGRYFYGDYCSGFVWSLAVADGRASEPRRHGFRVGGLSSFGEDAAGELYLVSLAGSVFRLDPR